MNICGKKVWTLPPEAVLNENKNGQVALEHRS